MDRAPYGYGPVFHGHAYPRAAAAAYPHSPAAFPYATTAAYQHSPAAFPYATTAAYQHSPAAFPDATTAAYPHSPAAFPDAASSAYPHADSGNLTAESASRGGFNAAGRGPEYPSPYFAPVGGRGYDQSVFAAERYGRAPGYGEQLYAAEVGPHLAAADDRSFAAFGGPPFPALGPTFIGAGAPHLDDAEGGMPSTYALWESSTCGVSNSNHQGGASDPAGSGHTSSTGASGHWSAKLPMPSDLEVQTVTRHNSHSVFRNIRQSLQNRTGRLCIAMDLEYAASASTGTTERPHTWHRWYTDLRDYVNNGDVVQIGLVFAFEDRQTQPYEAYQIDVYIKAENGNYSENSLAFLRNKHHNLESYRDNGVLAEWIFADLITHLPFHDHSVTWITFHGDRDFAFIMKLAVIGGKGLLPEDKLLFLNDYRRYFPSVFDVRVLAQIVVPGFAGSLETLSGKEHLSIKRSGEQHFAGSDALLTLECFLKILQSCTPDELLARQGLLSGDEELEMSIKCSAALSASTSYVIKVTDENYDQEGAKIYDSLCSNFNIIAMKVLLPTVVEVPSDGNPTTAQAMYYRLQAVIEGVQKFEVQVCFMNDERKIAYGRVWHFNLDVITEQPLRFARLLASSGATHNPNRIWITVHGARGVGCLLKSFLGPARLPEIYAEYVSSRSSCFPSLLDLACVATSSAKIHFLPTGCKGGLAHLAGSLGVPNHQCDLVTMLRCYACLRDSGDLDFLPSGLMDKCCYKCTV